MIRVFTDCNEEQKALICTVLDEYCVKYDIDVTVIPGIIYSQRIYNIKVDLDREKIIKWKDGTECSPDEFITNKVNQALNIIDGYRLEASDLNANLAKELAQRQNPKPKRKRRAKNNLKRKERIPSFEEFLQQSLNKEQKQDLTKHLNSFGKFLEHLGCVSLTDEHVIGHSVTNDAESVEKQIEEAERQGKVIKFDNLPPDIQEMLLQQYPKKVLRSNACKIILQEEGFSIIIKPQ